MSDLIDRQQAIEVLRNRWLKTRNYEGIGEDIAEECEIYLKTLPTVQPDHNAEPSKMEIIHCKDCKRFRKPSSIVNADWGWCSGWPTPLTTFVKVDGFCHRAEKRGEAE